MVNNVRLSGHESTFDVQRLVYYYRILIGSLYYYYSFYMPHCLIAPPYSPQFLLYAAYNAIADTLGCRISQEGRQGPYVICPLFLFFSPPSLRRQKATPRRRHRRSLQGNRFSGDDPIFYIHTYNGTTWTWISLPRCSSFSPPPAAAHPVSR